MEVTRVKVFPFDLRRMRSNLRAMAEVELDGKLLIRGIRVLENRSGGRYLAMPSQRRRDDTYIDLVEFQDPEFVVQMRALIMAELKRIESDER